jgi:tetraacyldisaccharide 4'-kinase
MHPAIISRGYGGSTRERVNWVSDGTEVLLNADYAGDEPRLLAETLPGVPVLTGIVRRLPAAAAEKRGADVLVLDDGFQHLAVGRDLDFVLFNANTLAGNSRIFPGGDLREPVAALKRCQAFVITGLHDDNRERAGRFAELLHQRFFEKPVFFSRYLPEYLVRRKEAEQMMIKVKPPGPGKRGYGFCGIARPESFQFTLREIGLDIMWLDALKDHHRYRKGELQQLVKRAQQVGADYLVTTEKDLVKAGLEELALPLYAVRMKVQMEDEEAFNAFLLQTIAGGETAEAECHGSVS